MTNYNIFAKFYDSIMGDRYTEADVIKELILKKCPKAEKILDIACGTGSILKLMPGKYKIYGLDASKEMLAVAEKKVSRARLSCQDMRDFKFSEKFDVILCLFDSINHLIELDDWKKVFINAQKYLNNNGVFIFDMNTEKKLRNLSDKSPFTRKFDGKYMIMNITNKGKGVVNWNIKVFEEKNKNMIFEENIEEKSFPVEGITEILNNIYSEVESFDQEKNKVSENSNRVYFICSK